MPLYLDRANLADISEAILEAGERVMGAYQHSVPITVEAVQPDMITEALSQLIDIMHMIEVDQANDISFQDVTYQYPNSTDTNESEFEPLSAEEISEIGNHGLGLIETLSEWAGNLKLTKERQQLRAVMVVVSLWIARHGGYLSTLDTIVDTLAQMANRTSDSQVLKELSTVMGEIINAVDTSIRYADDDDHAKMSWRVLNINRGIIATRTYDPNVMEPVFDQIVMNIPQEAPVFFESGMQQMEALDYPMHIRDIMNRYLLDCGSTTVH